VANDRSKASSVAIPIRVPASGAEKVCRHWQGDRGFQHWRREEHKRNRRVVKPGGSHASAIVSGGWEYDRRASAMG